MIETKSRFSYSEVLDIRTIQNVLNALDKGLAFFQKHGIKVNAIQTDNAMMFKGTNFIISDNYNNYLLKHNIAKRLIPLGVPQCNGCIERFHLTIDKKCSSLLAEAHTLSDVKWIINNFSNEYNFNHYHYYSELECNKNLNYTQRYMKQNT